jgi:hypothetical protein
VGLIRSGTQSIVIASELAEHSKLSGFEHGLRKVAQVIFGCVVGLGVTVAISRIWPVKSPSGNDLGRVVGISDVASFVFNTRTQSFSAFSCPGDFGTSAQGINNRGQIAGQCRTEDGGPLLGFIATPQDGEDD